MTSIPRPGRNTGTRCRDRRPSLPPQPRILLCLSLLCIPVSFPGSAPWCWPVLLGACAPPRESSGSIPASPGHLVSLRQDLAHALWAAQDADGGWHSQTYAVLRGGHALTALLLAGLVALPQDDDAAPMGARARALAFLRAAIDSPAGLGNPTDQPREYPTYATAFALLALVRTDEAEDTVRRSRLIAWLKACQRSEQNGFAASHRAFGGWGFTVVDQPGFAGHTDLAHTRWALSALAAAGALDDATRATHFLALCQRRDTERLPPEATPADGGLYLSPVVWPANKGGPGHWSSSYASATWYMRARVSGGWISIRAGTAPLGYPRPPTPTGRQPCAVIISAPARTPTPAGAPCWASKTGTVNFSTLCHPRAGMACMPIRKAF